MKLLLAGASALALTAVTAGPGFAQTATAQKDASGQIEAIVVTGTRTAGLKAVDSPAPVQVLGSDILKRVGQPDLVQSLALNIPSLQAQTFGSDQNHWVSAEINPADPQVFTFHQHIVKANEPVYVSP